MEEADWKRLLRQVRQGYVVPVIGSQLLADGDGPSYQQQVAAELLSSYGLTADADALPAFLPIAHVVTRLLDEAGATLQDLYADVHDAYETVAGRLDGALPEPLVQLAAISDFRLFVTTHADDLLARALRVHGPVDEVVHAPRLPTSEWHDLAPDWAERPGTRQLLYLFGKSRAAPVYAIHEEDVLEYAHNILSRGSQVPVNFLAALQQRSLLLLGCRFPDWLGRLFLRMTTGGRLADKRRREWLVEQGGTGDGLVAFLRAFSRDTEVLLQDSPAAFVAELHQRWLAEAAPAPAASGAPAPAPASRRAPPLFFVSYSRGSDLAAADAIVAALRDIGVGAQEVWLDRQAIEPGENFRHEIFDGIAGCRYFLPLLSAATNGREEGFVFREWRAANDRAKGMNRSFIVPIVVDDAFEPGSYDAAPVRDWAELDFGHAPQGLPDDGTRQRLVGLLRDARRQQG